ncbi:hypothetical protein PF001_g27290 [Phytophthora fragariae]|uniref:Uncharacterized protein n=4 Tax=Phytophthora fragariae TaxID=53985 RepID=A0A6A4BMM9_9STRA|nr:hypothetical protein PF001_g27290 [Phytophthora fragariae]
MRITYEDADGYNLDQEVLIQEMLKDHSMEHAHGYCSAVQEPRWKVGFQHLGSLPDDIAVAVKAAVPMVQRFQSQAQAKVDDCALLEQETPDPLST